VAACKLVNPQSLIAGSGLAKGKQQGAKRPTGGGDGGDVDWKDRDPAWAREQGRYAEPIPSRELILQVLREFDAPMGFSALTTELGVRGQSRRHALQTRLRAMIRDAQVICNRRNEYCLVDRIPLVTGRVSGHRDGYGFLIPDDGTDDVYLSPRQMREVMHGDRAAIRIRGHDRRGRPDGAIAEVLEHANRRVAGRFVDEHGVGFVIPDNPRLNHRIIIPQGARGKARGHLMVVAEITSPPTADAEAIGRIVEVLGAPDKPGLATEIAMRSHGLPYDWPGAVEREAAGLPKRVPTAAKRNREDLRELPLVTIDGEDARDFDDAVYCESTRSGWRLIVAIADVSHYVKPGSALDEEAHERGTSVYFPDRVVPMLPEGLSNELCSLKPKVDRLSMVCEMRINRDGKVTRAKFYESVIRSHARLTYIQVAAALAGDAAERRRLGHVLENVDALHALYRVLAEARAARGAIDFDMPSLQPELDEAGRITGFHAYERNDAHKLIEEAMITANVQAAKFLKRHHMPTLYRRHDAPDEDRIESLREFLRSVGLRLAPHSKLKPADMRRVLAQAKGRPDASMIETVVLRAMSLAIYHPASDGHFGLALGEYAHFTSPIRRYPDLLVHRGIRHVLGGGKARDFIYSAARMEQLGKHCSATERRADEATREVMDWLKCELMADHLGDAFDAVVTGVTNFGLFVQLEDTRVEGLVHISSLGQDYFTHEPDRHRLVGRRTGRTFQLSDRLQVQVTKVDLEARRIDFELVDGGARRQSKLARPGRANETVEQAGDEGQPRRQDAPAPHRGQAKRKRSGKRPAAGRTGRSAAAGGGEGKSAASGGQGKANGAGSGSGRGKRARRPAGR
jgi:ribonuclease R